MKKAATRQTGAVFSGADGTMAGKMDGRFAVGDLIMGRYKVLTELEQGGMGLFYKCLDEISGLEIALKALSGELSHNPQEMENVKKSFQTVHNLRHPHIASCDTLEKDSSGNYYLIMEFTGSEDLGKWINRKRQEGTLEINALLRVIRQTADALDYAHRRKVTHQNIKPENIMIDAEGEVKVIDFGLAQQICTSLTPGRETSPYMAPEQWQGRTLGAGADQYSLAVMTYEMLAGHLPSESTDPMVLREAVLSNPLKGLPDLPAGVMDALTQALSMNPAERFVGCTEFAAALGKRRKQLNVKTWSSEKADVAVFAMLLILAAGIAVGFTVSRYLQMEQLAEEQRQNESDVRREAEGKRIAEAMLLKAAEERRIEEEKTEEERRLKEAAARRKAEGKRIAEEKARKAAEAKRIAEEKARKAAEAKRLKESREAAESLYRSGRECSARKDYVQAADYYRKAALQGHAAAQFSLGLCCHTGRGTEKDISEAVKWYRQAAEQGYADAQCMLGLCCENGLGMKKNLSQAVMWYRKAAAQGNARAQYMLGLCCENGRGIEKDLTAAITCYREAAEQGYADAQCMLGFCYEHGRGMEKSLTEAVKWYRKAAAQGNARAQHLLGLCYYIGMGVEKDTYAAVACYRKSADQGYAPAQFSLGICYFYGHGLPRDITEAVKWYRKAAVQGHAAAQFNLGRCYEYGQGVGINIHAAVRLYRRAAEQGNVNAQKKLKKLKL